MITITKDTNIVNGKPEWTITVDNDTIRVNRRYCSEYGRMAYHSRGIYWLTLEDIIDWLTIWRETR